MLATIFNLLSNSPQARIPKIHFALCQGNKLFDFSSLDDA